MLKIKTDAKTFILSKLSTENIYTLWGALLLFLTTQIIIPLEPVPITLQTVGVLLIGLTFNQKSALQSVLLYLASGLAGLPVFTNFSGGFYKLLGPTGGYLVGFFFAVLFMTWVRKYFDNNNSFFITLNCLLGTLIIFCSGIGWLAYLIGFKAAITSGFLPFIIPGLIKVLVLVLGVRYLKSGRVV